ncbi:MAG: DUF2147 domain-containing protein [Spirochaetia bacterium]
MKKMIFTLFLSIFASALYAQAANDILGYWYGPKEKNGEQMITEIFEHRGKYYSYGFGYRSGGTGMVDDVRNPDPELKGRSLVGAIFVYDVVFNAGKKSWENGEIYRPMDGKYFYLNTKSFSADKKTLVWRASLDKAGRMGADLEWTRVPEAELKDHLSRKPSKERVLSTMPKTRQKPL